MPRPARQTIGLQTRGQIAQQPALEGGVQLRGQREQSQLGGFTQGTTVLEAQVWRRTQQEKARELCLPCSRFQKVCHGRRANSRARLGIGQQHVEGAHRHQGFF